MQSVVAVKFIESRGQTISLSKDKVTVRGPRLVLLRISQKMSTSNGVPALNHIKLQVCFSLRSFEYGILIYKFVSNVFLASSPKGLRCPQ
jgi:hypothetical protein